MQGCRGRLAYGACYRQTSDLLHARGHDLLLVGTSRLRLPVCLLEQCVQPTKLTCFARRCCCYVIGVIESTYEIALLILAVALVPALGYQIQAPKVNFVIAINTELCAVMHLQLSLIKHVIDEYRHSATLTTLRVAMSRLAHCCGAFDWCA